MKKVDLCLMDGIWLIGVNLKVGTTITDRKLIVVSKNDKLVTMIPIDRYSFKFRGSEDEENKSYEVVLRGEK